MQLKKLILSNLRKISALEPANIFAYISATFITHTHYLRFCSQLSGCIISWPSKAQHSWLAANNNYNYKSNERSKQQTCDNNNNNKLRNWQAMHEISQLVNRQISSPERERPRLQLQQQQQMQLQHLHAACECPKCPRRGALWGVGWRANYATRRQQQMK